jgi:hypothetical protein
VTCWQAIDGPIKHTGRKTASTRDAALSTTAASRTAAPSYCRWKCSTKPLSSYHLPATECQSHHSLFTQPGGNIHCDSMSLACAEIRWNRSRVRCLTDCMYISCDCGGLKRDSALPAGLRWRVRAAPMETTTRQATMTMTMMAEVDSAAIFEGQDIVREVCWREKARTWREEAERKGKGKKEKGLDKIRHEYVGSVWVWPFLIGLLSYIYLYSLARGASVNCCLISPPQRRTLYINHAPSSPGWMSWPVSPAWLENSPFRPAFQCSHRACSEQQADTMTSNLNGTNADLSLTILQVRYLYHRSGMNSSVSRI